VIDAGLTIEDFAEATGIELPDGDYETAAGYLVARLGRLPDVGDGVDVGAARLEVEEMDGRRVTRIAITEPKVAP
jgi:putative hemolysin